MDQSKPLPHPPKAENESENPIAALGRKCSTARGPSTYGEPQGLPTTTGNADFHASPQAAGNEKASGNGFGASMRSLFSRSPNHEESKSYSDEYDTDDVDLMDMLDPEVATLSTLTNVQNSLFIPQLGRVENRRATYQFSSSPHKARTLDTLKAKLLRITTGTEKRETQDPASALRDCQYAVLPEGMVLEGWAEEEKAELDDAVRHQLHSRRAKMRRCLKGFGQYVRRPLGLFVTLYATLITLFGAAWVLFLIGWISIGSKRDYVINVVDNVLVALFAIIGDGLAPFRAVDTYHMIYIAHYHRRTWKLCGKLGLPELVDANDLPEQREEDTPPEPEGGGHRITRCPPAPPSLARRIAPRIPSSLANRMFSRWGTASPPPEQEFSVLSPEEVSTFAGIPHPQIFEIAHLLQAARDGDTLRLPSPPLYGNRGAAGSAFLLADKSGGACKWGIPYETRPFALTTVMLCCSITCNIMGGVLISLGDKKARKKDVVERMLRQDLISEAIGTMEDRWMREAEGRGEMDPEVRETREKAKEEKENEEIKKSWRAAPLLPKHLLGEGEDKRQPSLLQEQRRSSSQVISAGSGSSILL